MMYNVFVTLSKPEKKIVTNMFTGQAPEHIKSVVNDYYAPEIDDGYTLLITSITDEFGNYYPV